TRSINGEALRRTHMSFWRRWFTTEVQPESPLYGLDKDNPVLCGGGPSGEREYLSRLRCPSGAPIRYERLGSSSTTNTAFLQRSEVSVYLGPSVSPRRAASYRDMNEVPLDIYRLECECGRHSVNVFLDMYHRGPVAPIGSKGWNLAAGGMPESQ